MVSFFWCCIYSAHHFSHMHHNKGVHLQILHQHYTQSTIIYRVQKHTIRIFRNIQGNLKKKIYNVIIYSFPYFFHKPSAHHKMASSYTQGVTENCIILHICTQRPVTQVLIREFFADNAALVVHASKTLRRLINHLYLGSGRKVHWPRIHKPQQRNTEFNKRFGKVTVTGAYLTKMVYHKHKGNISRLFTSKESLVSHGVIRSPTRTCSWRLESQICMRLSARIACGGWDRCAGWIKATSLKTCSTVTWDLLLDWLEDQPCLSKMSASVTWWLVTLTQHWDVGIVGRGSHKLEGSHPRGWNKEKELGKERRHRQRDMAEIPQPPSPKESTFICSDCNKSCVSCVGPHRHSRECSSHCSAAFQPYPTHWRCLLPNIISTSYLKLGHL